MAKKLVEFVPNFSEGRDKAKVEKIVDEARKISGLKILDYSSDPDHNRSVVTIIGIVLKRLTGSCHQYWQR